MGFLLPLTALGCTTSFLCESFVLSLVNTAFLESSKTLEQPEREFRYIKPSFFPPNINTTGQLYI